MAVGATAALLDERPTPKSVFQVMKREQPTIFFGVPTLYAAILNDPDCTPANGSQRLRLCVSAGEALPEHVGLAWKKRFGLDILDGTGSTEMLHIYLTNAPGDIRYGTSGRAVPGYELRVVDEEGRDVAVGETELGALDEAAFDDLMAEDPDEALGLLADMTRATDSRLRELARRLAGRLVLDVARRGPTRPAVSAASKWRGTSPTPVISTSTPAARRSSRPRPRARRSTPSGCGSGAGCSRAPPCACSWTAAGR